MSSKYLDLFNSNEWKEFYNYCNKGIFKQIDFFRYEDVHTNYLKSLFEKDNVFQLGSMPLELLIELLKNNDDDKTKHKLKDIDFNLCVITEFDTKKQVCIDSGRLDLLIDFSIYNKINYSEKKYSIILENKVLSSERENQTKNYQDYYEENNDGSIEYIYVFLSLEKNVKLSSDGSKYGDYIKITYQELIDNVLEECSKKEDKNIVPINIDEYLKGFTYLCEFDLMPNTSKLESLVEKIFKKYKDTIYELLDNNQYDYELKVLFSALSYKYDSVKSKYFKVIGRCEFNKKEYRVHEKTKMVLDLLIDMITHNKIARLDQLKELYYDSGWEVVISEDIYHNMTSRRDNFRVLDNIKLEGKSLYYSFPVSRDELKGFVNFVIKNKKYGYTDEDIKLYY